MTSRVKTNSKKFLIIQSKKSLGIFIPCIILGVQYIMVQYNEMNPYNSLYCWFYRMTHDNHDDAG